MSAGRVFHLSCQLFIWYPESIIIAMIIEVVKTLTEAGVMYNMNTGPTLVSNV